MKDREKAEVRSFWNNMDICRQDAIRGRENNLGENYMNERKIILWEKLVKEIIISLHKNCYINTVNVLYYAEGRQIQKSFKL
jgi:hypothetical protein